MNATRARRLSRRSFQSLFQRAPTLGGECYHHGEPSPKAEIQAAFQRAPTLGGECYQRQSGVQRTRRERGFNGHPPLGVNATNTQTVRLSTASPSFQRAPTLGGECYLSQRLTPCIKQLTVFQRAPTLGGECYQLHANQPPLGTSRGFNGHPPLGVNATAAPALERVVG